MSFKLPIRNGGRKRHRLICVSATPETGPIASPLIVSVTYCPCTVSFYFECWGITMATNNRRQGQGKLWLTPRLHFWCCWRSCVRSVEEHSQPDETLWVQVPTRIEEGREEREGGKRKGGREEGGREEGGKEEEGREGRGKEEREGGKDTKE